MLELNLSCKDRFKILWIKSLSLIIGNGHGLKLTLAKCVLKRADKTQRSTSYLHFDIWSKTSYSNHQFINEAFTTCYPLASNQISSLMIWESITRLRKELKRILKKRNIAMVINNREDWVKKETMPKAPIFYKTR